MVRADKGSLDVGGFVFVFHVVKCRVDGFLQNMFVISYKEVVKGQLFL